MALIVDTSINRAFEGEPARTYYTYNGLDCCLTHEILDALLPQLDENTAKIYRFERDLQAPLLEMSRRGVLVNRLLRDHMVRGLQSRAEKLLSILQLYAEAFWGKPLNPGSPTQLKSFFYEALQIPEIKTQVQGKWQVSTNREALEKMLNYYHARPVVKALLAWRDVTKQIQALTTGIDSDSRFRTSFNIAGTVTGRLSSSENPFGTGGNTQNLTGELRIVFEADPGYKLGYFDLQQAESRAVGLLAYLVSGISTYLDACEAGDLHTVVAKLCWPTLPWTGDLKHDRALAEEPFYRMFSRRDLAKRGGHGSNYFGQPPTIARNLKIELAIARAFQAAYFKAFPEITYWHEDVIRQIKQNGYLITPFGRYRQFFGRATDSSTHRAAIAHVPQSLIADMVDSSVIRVHREVPKVQLLLQVHDAIVVQYREDEEAEVVPQIIRCMEQRLEIPSFSVMRGSQRIEAPGRTFFIGSDPMVGWNWAKANTPEYAAKKKLIYNPDGMKDWKGGDSRSRVGVQIPNLGQPGVEILKQLM